MGEQLELRLAVGVLLGVLDSREPPSPIRRPHGLIDLLIILSTFALLQFNPAPLGRVAFTFVTSSCRCHPPSLVITLKDDALWIQSNEGKRWFAHGATFLGHARSILLKEQVVIAPPS